MEFNPAMIGQIVGGVAGTSKAIAGIVQYTRANKKLNQLLANRPQYKISQGYQDAYKTYQKLASSQLPGYGLMQDQIGQATAKATSTAEQGAMSSNQFMGAALGAQERELDAIRNLGIMSAQWRGQQQQNLANAQNQMGSLQDTQWQTNVLEPWNIRANMASENRQNGMQNFFTGVDDIAGMAQTYAGTSAYMKALNETKLQQGGANGGAFGGQGMNINLGGNNAWANWASPNFQMPSYKDNPYLNK